MVCEAPGRPSGSRTVGKLCAALTPLISLHAPAFPQPQERRPPPRRRTRSGPCARPGACAASRPAGLFGPFPAGAFPEASVFARRGSRLALALLHGEVGGSSHARERLRWPDGAGPGRGAGGSRPPVPCSPAGGRCPSALRCPALKHSALCTPPTAPCPLHARPSLPLHTWHGPVAPRTHQGVHDERARHTRGRRLVSVTVAKTSGARRPGGGGGWGAGAGGGCKHCWDLGYCVREGSAGHPFDPYCGPPSTAPATWGGGGAHSGTRPRGAQRARHGAMLGVAAAGRGPTRPRWVWPPDARQRRGARRLAG